MDKTKKNNRLNNIIKDLSSDDKMKVSVALTQLRKHGTKEAILPLIETYVNYNNEEIKREALAILYDLKDQSVAEEVILAIESDQFANDKNALIAIFWQSSLDGSQYISTFVKEAIKGDYLTCIEALSVIENFDASFDESEIEDLKYDLDEAIEIEEEEKAKILLVIKSTLEALNIEY
jgi:hypothetical protein